MTLIWGSGWSSFGLQREVQLENSQEARWRGYDCSTRPSQCVRTCIHRGYVWSSRPSWCHLGRYARALRAWHSSVGWHHGYHGGARQQLVGLRCLHVLRWGSGVVESEGSSLPQLHLGSLRAWLSYSGWKYGLVSSWEVHELLLSG